jgi:mRNA interferase RelE/StbE
VAVYRLLLKDSAAKEIDALPTKQDRRRVVARIQLLANDPRPHGSEKLAGGSEHYRVRQGRYRIVYQIRDRELVVAVVRVAHRKDAYR